MPTAHALATTLLLLAAAAAQDTAPPAFDRDVRPILAGHCFACHGPDANQRQGKLRLDQREAAVARGAFVPGDASTSELVRRIDHPDADERMPPADSGHALTDAERTTLRRWIDAGARYEPHWAFVPPSRPPVPIVGDDGFVRNPIDAFVRTAMRSHGLEPSPAAPAAALLRRLALDLTGLPPTVAAVHAFVADRAPDAYARAVTELMASPHYGEHMALPWLDAARYADSNGYQHDGDRQAWPWRDWLVRAFNANRRLDDLVVEMLAGDLLPQPSRDQIVATAFGRHHPLNNEGGAIPDEVRFQYVVDRANTAATVFLGLTLGCAQCHDHKYDPFTQREYYQWFAFFDNVDEDGKVALTRRNTYHEFQVSQPWLELSDPETQRALTQTTAAFEAAKTAWQAVEKPLSDALAAWMRTVPDADLVRLPDGVASAVRKQRGTPLTGPEYRRVRTYFATVAAGDPEWARLQGALDDSDAAVAALHERLPVVMVMRERAERRSTRLHARGAYDQPTGAALPPGVPAALQPLDPPSAAPADRLALARWIVAPRNPLFARVMVNRIWQGFFGRGLVTTPEDFGTTGERPTHAALLDWLAVEWIESGYDVQHLQRLIVTSGTYRQSSSVPADRLRADPQGTWLARSPRYRLSSLVLRDSALALAGLLDPRVGGPPVYPPQPPGLWLDVSFEVFAYPHDRSGEQHRRSLYTFWRRAVAPPDLFDVANRQTCVVRPVRTNTPLHALVMLNDPTYVEAARGLAQRVLRQSDTSDETRLARMFELATCRLPQRAELDVLASALARQRQRYAHDLAAAQALVAVGGAPLARQHPPAEVAAFTVVAQIVLNLDEVLCRP